MLKKTITYTDFNGLERTEDFFFNLTQSEIIEMEYSIDGGMQSLLEKIVAEKDQRRLMERFKDLILRAYGEKSADGKRFVKTPEIREAFSQTEAYNKLFMELLTDSTAASYFVNNIMPTEIMNQMAKTDIEVPGSVK